MRRASPALAFAPAPPEAERRPRCAPPEVCTARGPVHPDAPRPEAHRVHAGTPLYTRARHRPLVRRRCRRRTRVTRAAVARRVSPPSRRRHQESLPGLFKPFLSPPVRHAEPLRRH
jgi:hypothetical protein